MTPRRAIAVTGGTLVVTACFVALLGGGLVVDAAVLGTHALASSVVGAWAGGRDARLGDRGLVRGLAAWVALSLVLVYGPATWLGREAPQAALAGVTVGAAWAGAFLGSALTRRGTPRPCGTTTSAD